MKLYTEEDIARAVMFGRWGGTMKKDYQEFLNKLTPIELPSDEEIGQEAFEYYKSNVGNLDREIGFRYACKWIIEQLKQRQ